MKLTIHTKDFSSLMVRHYLLYCMHVFSFLGCGTKFNTRDGAYTDYVDQNLTTTGHYGENYPRLQELKEKWDPRWLLSNFPSGIEPAKVSHTLPFYTLSNSYWVTFRKAFE